MAEFKPGVSASIPPSTNDDGAAMAKRTTNVAHHARCNDGIVS